MSAAHARPLSLDRFLAEGGLDKRIQYLNGVFGRRLSSGQAATVWLDLLQQCAAGADAADHLASMIRQFLCLAPTHPQAEALCALLMARPAQPLPRGDLVAMIPSCQRYLGKALHLQASLCRQGLTAWVLVGDPGLSHVRVHGGVLQLSVADTYEALPRKVLEGLTAIRQLHGDVNVLKLDDDCTPMPGFDPARLQAIAQQCDYAGVPVGGTDCDRCWHVGKTASPVPVYSRRVKGHWARGAAYVLSHRAAGLLTHEWLFYPGEFDGEPYEDKMVGDFLRRQGLTLTPLDHQTMRIAADMTERPAAVAA